MMKKQITTLFLAVVLTFSLAAVGFAEEKQAETPVDPNATNLTAVYPLLEEAVPAVPVKPESLKDAKAVTEYIAAVDNYLKAVQKYIDGTTNDLNKIIGQRNKAIASANKVLRIITLFLRRINRNKRIYGIITVDTFNVSTVIILFISSILFKNTF